MATTIDRTTTMMTTVRAAVAMTAIRTMMTMTVLAGIATALTGTGIATVLAAPDGGPGFLGDRAAMIRGIFWNIPNVPVVRP